MKATKTQEIASQEASSIAKPDVFEYLDFRKFLSDYYSYRKNLNSGYSYTIFGRKADMSPDLIRRITLGQRNLTRENMSGVAKACSLSIQATKYFLALVDWNQAETQAQRERHWEELVQLTPKHKPYSLKRDEIQIIARWYVLTILEMIRLKDFQPNPKWISERMVKPVSPVEVQEALDLLLKRQLITFENGTYKFSQSVIEGGDGETPSPVIKAYHAKVHTMGVESLFSVTPDKREFSSSSIGIKIEDLPKLKELARNFQRQVMELLDSAENADEIYQINVQCFPLTTQKKPDSKIS